MSSWGLGSVPWTPSPRLGSADRARCIPPLASNTATPGGGYAPGSSGDPKQGPQSDSGNEKWSESDTGMLTDRSVFFVKSIWMLGSSHGQPPQDCFKISWNTGQETWASVGKGRPMYSWFREKKYGKPRLNGRLFNWECRLITQIDSGWWFATFFIFPYIGNHHPNWRTHIFQRCRYTTNQRLIGHIHHHAEVSPWHLRRWVKILGIDPVKRHRTGKRHGCRSNVVWIGFSTMGIAHGIVGFPNMFRQTSHPNSFDSTCPTTIYCIDIRYYPILVPELSPTKQ